MPKQDAHEREIAPSVSASSPEELFGPPRKAEPAEEPSQDTAAQESEQEQVELEQEQKEEAKQEEEKLEEPEKKEDKSADSRRFKLWDGRELTADEITRNHELLEDLIVTRQQFPHIQRKYTDLLEETRKPKEEPTKPAEDKPAPRQQTMEEWQASLKPTVEKLKSSGAITDDDVNFAPGLVNLVVHLLQDHEALKQNTLTTYEKEVKPFVELVQHVQQQAERENFLSTLNRSLEKLSSQADFFQPLSQPENREQFIKHLSEKVNPAVDVIMGDGAVEYLAGEYVAYQREPLLKAVSQASKKRASAAQTSPTAGEGSSASPGKAKQKPNQDILDLFGR